MPCRKWSIECKKERCNTAGVGVRVEGSGCEREEEEEKEDTGPEQSSFRFSFFLSCSSSMPIVTAEYTLDGYFFFCQYNEITAATIVFNDSIH